MTEYFCLRPHSQGKCRRDCAGLGDSLLFGLTSVTCNNPNFVVYLYIYFYSSVKHRRDHADKMCLQCRYEGMAPGVPLLGNISAAFLSFSFLKIILL